MLAFLGVILHCEKGSAFDAGAEGFLSIGAGSSDEFGIDTVGIVGVDEVKVGFSFEAPPKRGNLVSSDRRHSIPYAGF